MKSHLSILLLLGFFLSSCSGAETTETNNSVQVELTETFSIGGGNPEDLNYLFTSVASVEVDDQGRIYMTGYFDQEIRVFDSEGVFIDTIGNDGSGPGEFRMILTMSRDRSGNLVVMDQATDSVSKFDDCGNYLDRYFVPNSQIRQIEALNDDNYLAVYTDLETDTVLHILNNEFELNDSFAYRDEFIQTDEQFEEITSRTLPGKFLIYDENTVYFSPVFYHGHIYKYQREGGAWTLDKVLSGFTEVPAFTSVNPDDATDNTYVMPLGNEIVAADINNESRGLFRTGDYNIIHFTSTRQSGALIFGAEVFSKENEFLGYTPIQNLSEGNMYALQMEHDDLNNFVYIVEIDEVEGTVLKKYQLDISDEINS